MNCKTCGNGYAENLRNKSWRGNTGGFCSHKCYFQDKKHRAIAKSPTQDGIPYYVMNNGYASVTAAYGKYLHIYIAEKALGKPLPAGSVVHHIDGNKLNNSRDNLLILQNEGEHQTLHAKMRIVQRGGIPGKHLICGLCQEMKILEDFSKHTKRHERYGRCGWCKPCARLKGRESHARRLERLKAAT